MSSVILKPGREKSVLNRHPWIFSGAVASFPPFRNGDVLSVHSSEGTFLAKAYFHTKNSISGRILTFQDEPIEQAIFQKLSQAIDARKRLFNLDETNCFRLVNAEGDGLSGLIIDLYDDVAVVQISTHGMEQFKEKIASFLMQELKLACVFEKSQSHARLQEGLTESVGPLKGECPHEIVCKENGILFTIDVHKGQKTGFFLDQREMRRLCGRLSAGKRVLNCFSYSGGFSLFALQGGASYVESVDISKRACELALTNTRLNHFAEERHMIRCEDVFTYLRSCPLLFDLIILDPPAFAKKRSDINEACRGYKEINRQVFQKAPPHSHLLTCSCSHFIDEKLFGQVIFQAALEANRDVQICSTHLQSWDHPTSLYHPEGSYLKSLLLFIR